VKHLIGFRKSEPVTVEKRGTSTACRIEYGVQCPATVRCYVVYRRERYVEVADVEVKEGLLRALPCSHFMFIDGLG
jgi:hypothetical protein